MLACWPSTASARSCTCGTCSTWWCRSAIIFIARDSRAPTGYVHRQFWELGQAEQFDYLIHMHLPWYFNFLISWHEAQRQIPLIRTSYEELFGDPAGTVRRVADFHGLQADDAAIAGALAHAAAQDTRLNQGVSGRGRQLLSPAQRDSHPPAGPRVARRAQVLRSVGIDELDGPSLAIYPPSAAAAPAASAGDADDDSGDGRLQAGVCLNLRTRPLGTHSST